LLSVFGQREEVGERLGPNFAFSNADSAEPGGDTASSATEIRAKMARQSKRALRIDADPLLLSLSPPQVIIHDKASKRGGEASFRSLAHLQRKCANAVPELPKKGQPNLEKSDTTQFIGMTGQGDHLSGLNCATMQKSPSLEKLLGHSRENQQFVKSTRNDEVRNRAIWS